MRRDRPTIQSPGVVLPAPARIAVPVPPPGPPGPDVRAIYEAQLDYVWHSLRRLGVPDKDLADVAHDVFVAVARALPSYDPGRPLKPWLFGVVFRVASDHLRLYRNVREVLDDTIEALDIQPTPEEALMDEEARRVVEECLSRLDIRLRAVLVMHDFSGHDVNEIAEALAIPVKTVYSRLRTARLRFSATAARLAAQRGLS
jgi:RNA polymerase sigma-70 factor, ECF subfamily